MKKSVIYSIILAIAIIICTAAVTAIIVLNATKTPTTQPAQTDTQQPTTTDSMPSNSEEQAVTLDNNGQPQITSDTVIISGRVNPEFPRRHNQVTLRFAEGTYFAPIQADATWRAEIPRNKITTAEQTVTITLESTDETVWRSAVISLPLTLSIEPNTQDSDNLTINWQSNPTTVSNVQSSDQDIAQLLNKLSLKRVGTVKGGSYDGYDLLLATDISCYGPCFNTLAARFLLSPTKDKLIVLKKYGVGLNDLYAFEMYEENSGGTLNLSNAIQEATEITIPSLDDTKSLSLPNSTYRLTYTGDIKITTSFEDDPMNVQIGTTGSGKPLYMSSDKNCLYVPRIDGTMAKYTYAIPFVDERNVPAITWTDGSVNEDSYIFAQQTGCGPTQCLDIVDDIDLKSNRVERAGQTSSGETIYQLTDTQDARYTEMYEQFGWTGYGEDRQRIDYQDFLDMHPIVFWETPHGEVVEMRSNNFIPLAECGKPVIYLYPKTEQLAHVSVGLKGTMTISEPEHGSTGWSVLARPDGYVINLADGATYPNLFWEGFGVEYTTPQEGFVVAQDDLNTWLPKTLDTIGFTQRERDEFLEFWLPRLPKTPYVFITFVDQHYFDRDAPLHITPRPDTVTRVFMEYRPLDAPISVEPLELPIIHRDGFTVVEWGGALYE